MPGFGRVGDLEGEDLDIILGRIDADEFNGFVLQTMSPEDKFAPWTATN